MTLQAQRKTKKRGFREPLKYFSDRKIQRYIATKIQKI
jgi:hypothetical protein